MGRISNKSPWVFGGCTFKAEQMLLIEWFQSLQHESKVNIKVLFKKWILFFGLKSNDVIKNKFKIMITHWPWAYDPEVYSRIMVSKTPHTITLLRDPADRLVSSYFYNLKRIYGNVFKASISDFENFLTNNYDEDFYC